VLDFLVSVPSLSPAALAGAALALHSLKAHSVLGHHRAATYRKRLDVCVELARSE